MQAPSTEAVPFKPRRHRLTHAWRVSTQTISGLLFLALFGVFIIQITARFGFNQPLAWTDEAAVILYLWVILWTAAWVVPERGGGLLGAPVFCQDASDSSSSVSMSICVLLC